jgi:hypothetical protein
MKKISILGRGTVGCLAAAHFLKHTDAEIEWVYDPEITPAAVGEGTQLGFPSSLKSSILFNYNDLSKIDSTIKTGILKKDWGNKNKEYFHSFYAGDCGIHFNAVVFQKYIFEKLKDNKRIKLVEKNCKPEELDSEHIMACTGSPYNTDEYNLRTNIPVNACYVSQSPWDRSLYDYTLTYAKKHGWVFGIPLNNRISIGYLYNDTITSLEEIKEEVAEILEEMNLIPSVQRHLTFKNYSRKQNYSSDGRIAYNGNASYFLEPLEATSTSFADDIIRRTYDIWTSNYPDPSIKIFNNNRVYDEMVTEIENMICLHYLADSKYDSDFWKFAQSKAINSIETAIKNNTLFSQIIDKAVNTEEDFYNMIVGTWDINSYRINIEGLGIKEKLKNML